MNREKVRENLESLKNSFLTKKFFPQLEFILGNILLIAGGSIISRKPEVGASVIVVGFILDYRVFNQTLYDLKTAQQNIEKTEEKIRTTREDIEETQEEVESTKDEIQEAQENIEATEDRVEEMKESVFSSISDYESSGFGSIEEGLQRVEEDLSDLEDEVGNIKSKVKRELDLNFF